MSNFVGLNVSLKEVSICVMGGDGSVLPRGSTPTDPAAKTRRLPAGLP